MFKNAMLLAVPAVLLLSSSGKAQGQIGCWSYPQNGGDCSGIERVCTMEDLCYSLERYPNRLEVPVEFAFEGGGYEGVTEILVCWEKGACEEYWNEGESKWECHAPVHLITHNQDFDVSVNINDPCI